jgi:glycosyltransferase involved in cell wall biosynthesis
MVVPVAYDITRLATRVLNRTPNGIDRVDFAFASHFLDPSRQDHAGVMMTLFGPRAHKEIARAVIDGISVHWGEEDDPDVDRIYAETVAFIGEKTERRRALARHVARGRMRRSVDALRWIGKHGFPIGRSLVADLPVGACYLNVSQFPLFLPRYFRWLKARSDVKAVFFIHDLLPIETPEYFRKAEFERHQARLATLAEFGSAAIVATEVVKAALGRQLALLKRDDMPILVAPLPVAPIFSRPDPVDRQLAGRPYFVMCGTIEPRKNHLLILHVWRELVRRNGAAAPKLLLIGDRGWENENIVDLLERCHGIRNHVIEISGLSTPSLKKLLQGARALLMPSFAEGFGLPVAEALAAKIPVIASDIPSFREIGGERLVLLSPIDGERWLETIRIFADPNRSERQALLAQMEDHQPPTWDGFFSTIENFISGLA